MSNLSRKLIFLKGRHSYDKGSQLTSHGRVCVPLSVDAVILSCTKHRSPSPDDIHHPLTSHSGVWVSWSVNAHCAHVGGRASLSVLMASVCVNLKSALLQVISVNKMSNVRSQDEMEYIFLIHFFGGNLVWSWATFPFCQTLRHVHFPFSIPRMSAYSLIGRGLKYWERIIWGK